MVLRVSRRYSSGMSPIGVFMLTLALTAMTLGLITLTRLRTHPPTDQRARNRRAFTAIVCFSLGIGLLGGGVIGPLIF